MIFHFVGILLFVYDPKSAQLSFLTVIVCGVLLLLNEKRSGNYKSYAFIFLGGYLVEVIGVNTQILFGNYSYGSALGIKLLNVPPLIGLNWLIIIISGASISRWILKDKPLWVLAIAAAFICTLLDVIIEPVAIKFNFWQWDGDVVPIYNYVCWFILSIAFSYVYLAKKTDINRIGIRTYGIWILFFSLLNIIQ